MDGGPCDAETVGVLACDADLHRVLMSGRSAVLDYGRAVRTVPTDLWNAVLVRDGHCRHPGCDRPPDWCEAHHVIPFPHGPTAIDNLVLLCSRHHHLVHRPDWHGKLRPDGEYEVTDAHGRVWVSRPGGW